MMINRRSLLTTALTLGAMKAFPGLSYAQARPLAEPLTSPGALRPGLPFRGPDWADTKQQWLARLQRGQRMQKHWHGERLCSLQ